MVLTILASSQFEIAVIKGQELQLLLSLKHRLINALVATKYVQLCVCLVHKLPGLPLRLSHCIKRTVNGSVVQIQSYTVLLLTYAIKTLSWSTRQQHHHQQSEAETDHHSAW